MAKLDTLPDLGYPSKIHSFGLPRSRPQQQKWNCLLYPSYFCLDVNPRYHPKITETNYDIVGCMHTVRIHRLAFYSIVIIRLPFSTFTWVYVDVHVCVMYVSSLRYSHICWRNLLHPEGPRLANAIATVVGCVSSATPSWQRLRRLRGKPGASCSNKWYGSNDPCWKALNFHCRRSSFKYM